MPSSLSSGTASSIVGGQFGNLAAASGVYPFHWGLPAPESTYLGAWGANYGKQAPGLDSKLWYDQDGNACFYLDETHGWFAWDLVDPVGAHILDSRWTWSYAYDEWCWHTIENQTGDGWIYRQGSNDWLRIKKG